LVTPIGDLNDTAVMQTVIIGEGDSLCSKDRDFFEPPTDSVAHLRSVVHREHSGFAELAVGGAQ
jgi:hypothetical protein